jgi:hypothetical protein
MSPLAALLLATATVAPTASVTSTTTPETPAATPTPTHTAAPTPTPLLEITKKVPGLVITLDMTAAHPGGVLIARVRATRALGPATFALEGRKNPVYYGPGGLRALVAVPLTMPPGPAILGLEILGRRGRRRVPIEVVIAPRAFTTRTHAIPMDRRALLERPERVRDSRLVLSAVRTESKSALAKGQLRPPVPVDPDVPFGGTETYEGAVFVPLLMDGIYGDHHRGIDYPVGIGTPVRAPGAGAVLLARPLALTGNTLAIDHGRGVVSVFFHLSRLDVAVGQKVDLGQIVGASGDSGLVNTPHLHWGVYLHGLAVDPRTLLAIDLG